MFRNIEGEFGDPVAVLVNNAVWARFQPLGEIDAETVNRMFAYGVKGLIWTTQAVAPQMERRGGGSIINLTSSPPSIQPRIYRLFRAEGGDRRAHSRGGDGIEPEAISGSTRSRRA